MASSTETPATADHETLSPARCESPNSQVCFVPRLQLLLSRLKLHHQIEDLHYIFRSADDCITHP